MSLPPPEVDEDDSEVYISQLEDDGTSQHSPAPTASTPVTLTLLRMDPESDGSVDELTMLMEAQSAESDPTAFCHALLDRAYNSTSLSPTDDGFAW